VGARGAGAAGKAYYAEEVRGKTVEVGLVNVLVGYDAEQRVDRVGHALFDPQL